MGNTSKNDDRILNLKKEIEKKTLDLKNKKTRFAPLTNCNLYLNGQKYNLHVLKKDELIHCLIQINIYLLSAKDLGYNENLILSGFKIFEWMDDIKTRIEICENKEEQIKLDKMNDKLKKLLSEEKRTEIELDEIESQL